MPYSWGTARCSTLTSPDDGVHSTERACLQCGSSFPQPDLQRTSATPAQGWCSWCRGFGELFYLPDVDHRGARADAIEESWFSWQEGNRVSCPACGGARLGRCLVGGGLEAGGADLRRAIPLKGAPTIDAISQSAVEDAFDFFKGLKFSGRDAAIARDILPEISERPVSVQGRSVIP
ncbi:MAG: hypothetical protein U1G07_04630 [Verrucomicrobiota bacterium]